MTKLSENAEVIALQALAWLVAQDKLCPIFMGATGASGADLQERITDTDFLGSVLDFLLQDDSWLISFCDDNALAYDLVARARTLLRKRECCKVEVTRRELDVQEQEGSWLLGAPRNSYNPTTVGAPHTLLPLQC